MRKKQTSVATGEIKKLPDARRPARPKILYIFEGGGGRRRGKKGGEGTYGKKK